MEISRGFNSNTSGTWKFLEVSNPIPLLHGNYRGLKSKYLCYMEIFRGFSSNTSKT
jgi:hypothetical protein